MDDASFESFGDFGDFQSASTVFDDDGTFGGSTELTPTGTDSSWTFAGVATPTSSTGLSVGGTGTGTASPASGAASDSSIASLDSVEEAIIGTGKK